MTVGTIDGGASARLRDATRSWTLRERAHCRRLHERRTANINGGDLVRRLYTIRGTPLEDVVAEAFDRMGLPFTKLDDGSHPGRPDFMVHIGTAQPLIIEVKSRVSDEQFIGLAAATEVLAASELMGYGTANCLTICSPAVDPSVPRLIGACGRLCVVDVADLTDAIVRMLRQEMPVQSLTNWLTAPGIAVMADLAPNDH
jgi:helicase